MTQCPGMHMIPMNNEQYWFIYVIIHFSVVFFRPEEVQSLISGKLALRYAGRQARTDHYLLIADSTKQGWILSNDAHYVN